MQNDYHTKKACIMAPKRKQYITKKSWLLLMCSVDMENSNSAQYEIQVDTRMCASFMFSTV